MSTPSATVIVAARRSPIGRAYKGSLREVRPDDLLVQMLQAALDDVPALDPAEVEDLIVGCGLPGGSQGYNIARVAAVMLGHDDMPGTTVTRYCASSVQALRMAHHAIQSGEGEVFLVGGVESLSFLRQGSPDDMPDSRNPLFADAQARTVERSGADAPDWDDPRDSGHVPDIYIPMGQTAENVAQVYGIDRAAQDAYALRSQTLVREGVESGFFAHEITPVRLADGTLVSADDSPRPTTTLEGLAALDPVFRPAGTVTAGNACPLNDGAAALVVMSEERARSLGLQPLAEVVATGVSALSAEIMGMGPVDAIRSVVGRAGLSLDDIDRIDINEAFAAQVIACIRELGVDPDRVNSRGGSLAMGHPFGMTGARMVTSLLNTMSQGGDRYGIVSMCVAGGQGMAVLLRNRQEEEDQ
ncbi:acetyl-CoA C-acetyltransferase [Leifsonia bigeumensis]|uniref:acetyl-CoA C-acyltransferase n=1 Tax=Leifsonella bigeumensis TaxID=433643 RepID=A0ABP7F9I9_9MICO